MGQKGGLKTRLRIFCRGEVAPTPVVQFRANISNDLITRYSIYKFKEEMHIHVCKNLANLIQKFVRLRII